MQNCPLCTNSEKNKTIELSNKKRYYCCNTCKLIYIDKKHLPNFDDERARYTKHKNSINDRGYVNFLKQSITPALHYLEPIHKGLDYGCGPSPTIYLLLKKHNIQCDNYDPFFYPEIPKKSYDFIFATECFEHFFIPDKDIKKITNLLKPGAYLIVMTEQWEDIEKFEKWYYTHDFTHVTFYHKQTMQYIAQTYGYRLIENINNRVSIFKKCTNRFDK
jgi:SAM-dependent methyltransferase